MNWLKQQHRALWRFYREALGESLLITAAAFVIICLLAFGAGLLNKSIPAMAMDYIQRIMDIKDIVTDEGGIDLAALFGNNVRAAAVSVLYGFIPLLYLTALAFACGFLLCKRTTQYVRKNTKGMMKPLMLDLLRVFVMHILPLLAVAAVVETFVTPAVMALFM